MSGPARRARAGVVAIAATALATAACAPDAAPPHAGSSSVTASRPRRVAPPPGPLPVGWLASEELCKKPGAKPAPHAFSGLLRGVRCDEQMFQTMANVATMLGVTCAYCHVPLPGRSDRLDYVTPTPHRTIANWMYQHLMQSVRPADGSAYTCASCHRDAHGKPTAKILGDPRDPARAHEWMMLSLVDRFVDAKGDRLRCKSCHVGNETTPAWRPTVLLQTEQLPPHAEPGPLEVPLAGASAAPTGPEHAPENAGEVPSGALGR